MHETALSPATIRQRKFRFRAWHRGTREADYMIGGFFDRYHAEWTDADYQWFDAVLNEQDVDIMAWMMGNDSPPTHLEGPWLAAMRRLDYIQIRKLDR